MLHGLSVTAGRLSVSVAEVIEMLHFPHGSHNPVEMKISRRQCSLETKNPRFRKQKAFHSNTHEAIQNTKYFKYVKWILHLGLFLRFAYKRSYPVLLCSASLQTFLHPQVHTQANCVSIFSELWTELRHFEREEVALRHRPLPTTEHVHTQCACGLVLRLTKVRLFILTTSLQMF